LSSWSGLPFVNLVWTQRTPWQEATRSRFGNSNLLEAIYRRDDVALVANPTDLAFYRIFAKEHFGANVELVPSRAPTDHFVAGRLAVWRSSRRRRYGGTVKPALRPGLGHAARHR
jgi:hypothetical protein